MTKATRSARATRNERRQARGEEGVSYRRATCVCMCVCVLPIVNPNQTKIKPSEDTHKHNTHTDVFKYILDIDICILQGRYMYSNYLLLLVPNNKRKFN